MSTSVKAFVEIELEGFSVPNYVIVKGGPGSRSEGLKERRKFHLSELDETTLNVLCDEFRRSILEEAKKGDPSESR